jgi:hypothetical protein
MCRRDLVVAATAADDESLVGDECHIVSAAGQGPRHDPAFSPDWFDKPENMVLLCRVHHKMVDDQHETYTADMLRALKANHEKWVSSSLSDGNARPRVSVRRLRETIPSHLVRLTSGREIMTVVDGACAFSFDQGELESQAEVDLLSEFLQEARDWGDLSGDIEAADRVQASYRLSALLKQVEDAGFWVFGGREVRRLEGGTEPSSPWPVAILKVVRSSSPEIIRIGMNDRRQTPPQNTDVDRRGEASQDP